MGELTQLFTDVANSIRKKDKTTQQIPARQFPERIDDLTVLEENQTIQGGEVYDVVDIEEETRDELSIREVCTLPGASTFRDTDIDGNILCTELGKVLKLSPPGEKIWEHIITGEYVSPHIASDGKSMFVSDHVDRGDYSVRMLNENGEVQWEIGKIKDSSSGLSFKGNIDGHAFFSANYAVERLVRITESTGAILDNSCYLSGYGEEKILKDGTIVSFRSSGDYKYLGRIDISLRKISTMSIEYIGVGNLCEDYKGRLYYSKRYDGIPGGVYRIDFDKNKPEQVHVMRDCTLFQSADNFYIRIPDSLFFAGKDIESPALEMFPFDAFNGMTYVYNIGDVLTMVNNSNDGFQMCRLNALGARGEVQAITEEMYNVICSGRKCTDGNYYGLSKGKLFMIDITITDTRKTATLQKIHGGGTLTE